MKDMHQNGIMIMRHSKENVTSHTLCVIRHVEICFLNISKNIVCHITNERSLTHNLQ